MKLFSTTLIAFTMLLASCADHHSEDTGLELNNGQKWKVNQEMKPHIEHGRLLLIAFLKEDGADHRQLADDLQEQNSKLIKSCTMDGASHDELHKWLHPHLELVKELKQAETEAEVSEITDQLEASYGLYDQYFQ